jgi:predicted DNA-binding transcriptional regulator YafY
VSVRTIYRYIDDLSAGGIPIYGTAGLGYQLVDGFELPPLSLTEEELEALMLGVSMVSEWTSHKLGKAAASLAHKIKAVTPPFLQEKYQDITYAYNYANRKNDKKTWEVLHQAIKKSESVNIDYYSLDESQTSRTIHPLGLFYWGGKWTIGSWCLLRQDFRDFRVDRIKAIHIQNIKSDATQRPTLSEYFAVRSKYY